MAYNKIYPWASTSDANVLDDTDYASALATNGAYEAGVKAGQASSKQANKTWRQGIAPASGLAQYIVDNLKVDVTDSDSPATFSSRLASVAVLLSQYRTIPSTLVKTLATGNFTVPPNVAFIRFRLRGGGGGGGAGGGNSTSAVSAGGGGGGGAYLDIVIPVVPGNNVSWVVGAGGSAGVNNGTSGTSGGDTILYVSGTEVARARGGSGGGNATFGGVGVGGTGGTTTVTSAKGWSDATGGGGGYGVYASNSQGWGGIGGASFGFSGTQVTGQNTAGHVGTEGGGGGGGTGTSNGGAGAQGSVSYEY